MKIKCIPNPLFYLSNKRDLLALSNIQHQLQLLMNTKDFK